MPVTTCAAMRPGSAVVPATTIETMVKIAAPTLCIAGASDGATPPELVKAMARRIKGSEFAVIDACAHLPCLEQPGKLAGLITSFIEKGSAHG